MTATLASGGNLPGMGKDTRTRYQGVFARHRKGCALERDRRCDCRPSYYGVVYDRAAGKHRKTTRCGTATAARNARADLAGAVDRGELPERTDVRLGDAVERFVEAAREGIALTKHGRRYKPRAVEDLAGALTVHALAQLGRQKRLADVRRADCQQLVDKLSAAGLSGSRVRSVVNALRSLYRWAQFRGMVAHDPAQHVQLPRMDATPRDRVATPGELRRLVDVLPLEDALPYALAAYATARRAELLALKWRDIDLDAGVLVLGAEVRKSDASLRQVPVLRALSALLRRRLLEQRPRPGKDVPVCPPRRASASGQLAPGRLQVRANEAWEAAGLVPIGLHECRHSAASWMDAAGVPAKLASELMGHATPAHQAGAARITLERYTHTLPGDLERARELLDTFIAERERQEAAEL